MIIDTKENVTHSYSVHQLFSPSSNPYGIAFREWTVRWWQWFLSLPQTSNPVNDGDGIGKNADNNQIYSEVHFLTGTTGGFVERQCSVPKGKAILCPIINFEISTAEAPNLDTDEALISFAKEDVDKIATLNVTVDGWSPIDLKKYRIASGIFDVTLPEDNIWGVKPGRTKAAADGYWIFLKPLSDGYHQIKFGGSCLAGTVNIGASYLISIR